MPTLRPPEHPEEVRSRDTAPAVTPRRVRRIQIVAVTLLSIAGVINYLDRGSLAIANTTICAELGFSGTRIGALFSLFSLCYAVAQLPSGLLLDRFGVRVVLGVGMFFWSLMQVAMGMVSSFLSLAAVRLGLALGEAPYVVSTVKATRDWFNVPQRATSVGIVNGSTTLGQAIAPLILTPIMLAFGWRGMFVLIGLPGLVLAIIWYVVYRDRTSVSLSPVERASFSEGDRDVERISLAQWRSLFRLRTVWGMMLGFGGINYTVWLYMSWMPRYFEDERHLSIAATGRIATIPFFCGALGMVVSGMVADRLVRRGMNPARSFKTMILCGLMGSGLCTLLVAGAPGVTSAAIGISLALFFIYFAGNAAWCLVQVMAPASMVASVSSIQNFGSFLCASLAPISAGWILDRTGSFRLSLVLCALVAFVGALSYFWIVRDPIRFPASAAAD